MSTAPVSFSGLTWEDFLNLPDEPRYKHAELLDGDLVLVNPPIWVHQRVIVRLVSAMDTWIQAGTGRGEVTMEPPVQITSIRGYLPDLAWHSEERSRPVAGNPYLSGSPDLAVEVLSPSTRAFDLIRKRTDYARVGVGELWLIDPDGPSALVLRLPEELFGPAEYVLVDEIGADGDLTSPLFPGLVIPLRSLVPAQA